MNNLNWRSWTGAEMTWMMYQHVVDSLEGHSKRQFLTAAEDVVALRELDKKAFKETELSVGSV
jgi:hypothetical protein